MSVLRSRILAQGQAGHQARPYGTSATPMVMPVSVVSYSPGERALNGQRYILTRFKEDAACGTSRVRLLGRDDLQLSGCCGVDFFQTTQRGLDVYLVERGQCGCDAG